MDGRHRTISSAPTRSSNTYEPARVAFVLGQPLAVCPDGICCAVCEEGLPLGIGTAQVSCDEQIPVYPFCSKNAMVTHLKTRHADWDEKRYTLLYKSLKSKWMHLCSELKKNPSQYHSHIRSGLPTQAYVCNGCNAVWSIPLKTNGTRHLMGSKAAIGCTKLEIKHCRYLKSGRLIPADILPPEPVPMILDRSNLNSNLHLDTDGESAGYPSGSAMAIDTGASLVAASYSVPRNRELQLSDTVVAVSESTTFERCHTVLPALSDMLEKYLVGREKPDAYLVIFHPMLRPNTTISGGQWTVTDFDSKVKDLVTLVNAAPDDDLLKYILDAAEQWLLLDCKEDVPTVPATARSHLNTVGSYIDGEEGPDSHHTF